MSAALERSRGFRWCVFIEKKEMGGWCSWIVIIARVGAGWCLAWMDGVHRLYVGWEYNLSL